MAIPINIDDLINLRVVESTRVEFKTGFNPNAIIHTICAFANDIDNIGGGYLVIGVEERDGSPVLPVKGVPQEEIDNILKRLVGLCHCIEPLYNPVVEPVLFGDSYVIVIWVPGGFGRPYKASKDVLSNNKAEKQYYIRKFSSTVIASPQEERELFYASSDIPFDDRPNLLAKVEDLDLGLMREHLAQIGSALYAQSISKTTEQLADDLQLLAGPPESRHPRNVGILMFSERPDLYFRYAKIEVVDMPDLTGEGMTEMSFTGPIQRQLKNALSYIETYVIKRKTSKFEDRAEAEVTVNYPMQAIEEILSNAVYHRSYQINEPITVRITPTALEITSFPGFDRSITDIDIQNKNFRARIYRNRRIGDFLKELRLVEGRNTGFPTAFASLAANGSGEPRFEMDEMRGYLSVIIPVHPAFNPSTTSNQRAMDFEADILALLSNKDMNLSELAQKLGYKGITKRLSSAVRGLIARDILEYAPQANGHNKLHIKE